MSDAAAQQKRVVVLGTRLARALHQGRSLIAARHAQGHESTLENTLVAAPRQDLIHPGVLRYMREAGLLR